MDLERLIERATPMGILGIQITQNGKRTRHFWDEDCRRNIYSCTKSFTSCAVGFAVSEGLLSLDEKIADAFPDELPEVVSENLEKMTVRHLLTMGLGQRSSSLMAAQRPKMKTADWVRYSLSLPVEDEPGTTFVYSNVGPYLAGILVQRRAGCTLVDYLMPRLFEKLEIYRPTWEVDPQGLNFGAAGLMLTLDELHRFGFLYLQNGQWKGQQVLPKGWVKESTRVQTDNGQDGYGYLFWGGPEGTFRADGKYSQLSIIHKEKNAVISCTAECHNGNLLDVIVEEIFPQL